MEFRCADRRDELAQARSDLIAALQEREETECEIARLKHRVAELSEFVDETEETDDLLDLGKNSLRDVVRTALRAFGRPVTQGEVREMLPKLRFPIEDHQNPIASIHTVLTRLIGDGDVAYGPKRDGKKTYRWVVRVFGASGSLANGLADMERDRTRRRLRGIP